MRQAFLAFLFIFCTGLAGSGEFGRVFLPDLLPSNTIFCMVPPDVVTLERDYSQSLFAHLASLPEMGPFLRSFEESRRQFAQDIAQGAGVPPPLAYELVTGKFGLALINITMGRDGKPLPEYVVAISLKNPPDRQTVFNAVMALLNRPEVVKTVLQSQGIDPNIPLRTLAQEETVAGAPPILRIGPNIRVASIGNMVLLYHGPGSEGVKKLFEAAQNPAASLSRYPSFAMSYRGAEAKPGAGLYYLNVPRGISILDALNLTQAARVVDALGFGSVQSIVMSDAFHQDGVRHTMFMHTPSGQPSGLMSALIPMPGDSPMGMESYANVIPSSADAFLAMRVDTSVLLREIPYILDSLGAVTRPGGMGAFAANERILGVPLADIFNVLGPDIVIRPQEDTQVLTFNNVDIPGFENLVARMEQNAGAPFSKQNIGGYIVRYFNRRSTLTVPLAPAFCLVPRSPGSQQGILYMAAYPQAVVSLLKELTSAREPIARNPDFLKAASGIGSGYSLFYYNGSRESYRRVYNFFLPVMSLWASSSRYQVDTGLLPTASSVMPAMFGSAMGVRCFPEGIQVQAFSPVGSAAILVQLMDKLVVSNPIVIGYVYGMMETWFSLLPTW